MEESKPVQLQMQMLQSGFDFIDEHEDITDTNKYVFEHGIIILEKDNLLGKWQARVIYSDGHKEIINLYELR